MLCPRCRNKKDEEKDFYISNSGAVIKPCKDCQKEKSRLFHLKYPDRIKAKNKRWRNTEQGKAKRKQESKSKVNRLSVSYMNCLLKKEEREITPESIEIRRVKVLVNRLKKKIKRKRNERHSELTKSSV